MSQPTTKKKSKPKTTRHEVRLYLYFKGHPGLWITNAVATKDNPTMGARTVRDYTAGFAKKGILLKTDAHPAPSFLLNPNMPERAKKLAARLDAAASAFGLTKGGA